MGRRRKKRYWGKVVKRDKGKPEEIATQMELTGFMEQSNGAVASNIRTYKLAKRQPDGLWHSDEQAIKKRIQALRDDIRENREYDREYMVNTVIEMGQDTGKLTRKQAENALNREKRDEALAVIAAAKAGKIRLSPADYRVLTPMREGRYLEAIYGKENQWEQGTLATRGRRKTARSSDPAHRARMQENTERLQEHRVTRSSTKADPNAVNPFARTARSESQREKTKDSWSDWLQPRPQPRQPETVKEWAWSQPTPENDIIF